MWNQKREKTVRDCVCPCPAWDPQGDYNLLIFLLLLPRGALVPLFLNYTRMYHAGKPETCGGLGPSHRVCLSLICVVSSLVLSFLFGKWRRPLCDFYVVVGVLTPGKRRLAHAGMPQPSGLWDGSGGSASAVSAVASALWDRGADQGGRCPSEEGGGKGKGGFGPVSFLTLRV